MPTTDTSSLLACSYGTAVLSLVDFSVNSVPHVKDQIGRVWTDVTTKATLELTETDAATFSAHAAIAYEQLTGDGRDFLVTGIGNTPLYSLLAAQCLNGGPHAACEIKNTGLLKMQFELTLTAQRFDPTTSPSNNFKIRVSTRADGLHSYVQSGEVLGPNATAFYLGTALPAAKRAWQLPGYSLEHEYEASVDANQSKVDYAITAIQYFGSLPAGAAGANGTPDVGAVSGEITVAMDRDEHYRRTTTTSYDLLIAGKDPTPIIAQLRTQAAAPAAAGGKPSIILRESGKQTTLKEQRISGSFVVLDSADKSPLLDWTETVSIKQSDSWSVRSYPGAQPVVVHAPKGLTRITQTGTAKAVGKFKRPTPIFNSFLSDPEVTTTDENDVEKRTTWHYEMYASVGGNVPDANYDGSKFDPGVMARSAQDDNYFPVKGGQ